jgi:hypothetical protein
MLVESLSLSNDRLWASLDTLMNVQILVQTSQHRKGVLQRQSQAAFTVKVSILERLEGLMRELFHFDYRSLTAGSCSATAKLR